MFQRQTFYLSSYAAQYLTQFVTGRVKIEKVD